MNLFLVGVKTIATLLVALLLAGFGWFAGIFSGMGVLRILGMQYSEDPGIVMGCMWAGPLAGLLTTFFIVRPMWRSRKKVVAAPNDLGIKLAPLLTEAMAWIKRQRPPVPQTREWYAMEQFNFCISVIDRSPNYAAGAVAELRKFIATQSNLDAEYLRAIKMFCDRIESTIHQAS